MKIHILDHAEDDLVDGYNTPKAESVRKFIDVVWIDMQPQAGHEQAGRRLAIVLSPSSYNGKVGLALFCPVTNQTKGYPFEVTIPSGLK